MIERDKVYKDVSGADVRIICVDRRGDYPIVGLKTVSDVEHVCHYDSNGTASICNTAYDLILPEDYSTYKIDEPVMVRDYDSQTWDRRHFAGVKNGKPTAWLLGYTSWTNDEPDVRTWKQCRRPTPEELGEKQ